MKPGIQVISGFIVPERPSIYFPQVAYNLDGCGTHLGIRRLNYGFGKELRCLRWRNMLGNLLGKNRMNMRPFKAKAIFS